MLERLVFRVRRRSHLHPELFGAQLRLEIEGISPIILAELRQALGGGKVTHNDIPRDNNIQLASQK